MRRKPEFNLCGIFLLAAAFISAAFSMSGCGRPGMPDNDVVAHVNKDVIYRKDLKREIALRAKRDPGFRQGPQTEAEQLEAMIDRKIMIQSAMEKGLANDEKFVSAIRNIWEHALIRDFIEHQKQEFHEFIFASKEDVAEYYNNMSYRLTFKVFKSLYFEDATDAYNRYIKTGDTSGWETIGPVSYDEIDSIPLMDAFGMADGQAGRFSDDSYFYVIEVSKRESVADVRPLSDILEDVERRVMEIKERRLFQEWMVNRKKNSKIKIKL